MPQTDVVIYAEEGEAPTIQWLDSLSARARTKCLVRIERLVEEGHELRRPEADTLRDGINELRVSLQGIQYRILYFFDEGKAVLSHGFIKKGGRVPEQEIDLAIEHRLRFKSDREQHTYREEEP